MAKLFKFIIIFFVCFALFFTLFNPIKAFVRGGEAIVTIIPVLLIFFYDRMWRSKYTFGVFIVVFSNFFLFYIGVEYFLDKYIPESVLLLFSVYAFEHYMKTKDTRYLKCVVYTEYIVIFVLIIISIPQFILMPNLTRVVEKAKDNPTEIEYYWSISYAAVHNLPVLSIPIIACFSFLKRWLRVTAFMGLLLIFVLMIFASSATSLLLLIGVYFFFMVYNRKKSFSVNFSRVLIGLLLISPLMSKSVQLSMIDATLPLFEGSQTAKRIDDIRWFVEHGETEGDMEGREDLYYHSIKSIIENPFLPETGKDKTGNHSYLLDHLCAMGLILFVPYACFIYSRFKRAYKLLPLYRLYLVLAFAIFLMLALFKNFFTFSSTMFIVPFSLILLDQKIKDYSYEV